ncbi:MAG: GDP-mannose 4,6-dehydratase [Chitinophagaceae bacterium]
MTKVAIITGITGQDGAYLAELLVKKNYKVIGLTRSYNQDNLKGLKYLNVLNKVLIEDCDLADITQILKIIHKYQPDEIYNLAAQSSVSLSFHQPIGTIQFNIVSVLNILEAIKLVNGVGSIRFYQASSSEMYGLVKQLPITENTVFHPLSPYAISKASAHWITVNYRESYNLFTCCGVLFNHESYLRSDNFFVKKVIRDSLRIKHGLQEEIKVGNIDIKRDFGFAPKYVEAMWMMLQKDKPDDYLICSGNSVSLREIIDHVFYKLSLPSKKMVIDKSLYRPTDIEDIFGSNDKAKQELGWQYDVHFFEIIDQLIEEVEINKQYLNAREN